VRPVEGSGQGVLVDRRRAGDDDRLRFGPDQRRQERAELLTDGEPGRIRAEPAVDAERLPLLEGAQRLGLGVAGEEPQRVPVEVDASRQQVKTLSEASQRIGRVEGQRFRVAGIAGGGDRFRRQASPLLPSSARAPHCLTRANPREVGRTREPPPNSTRPTMRTSFPRRTRA
jgi:hypothetical protein